MRILVTGGAGFIGSHLVERFLSRGHEVLAIDDFDDFYDPAIKRANIADASRGAAPFSRLDRSEADSAGRPDSGRPDGEEGGRGSSPGASSLGAFHLIEGDIRDHALVEKAFGSFAPELVVHLAARAGVRPSIEMPVLYESVNVGGTQVLLEACRRTGVRKFLFASSSSVYGNESKVPFSEDDPVARPVSPYAATKRAGELLGYTYWHLYGMSFWALRFFTVYGPRQRPEMAIHRFTRLIDEGEEVPQYGDGSSRRDYTWIDDIVDGVEAAAERIDGYEVLNLGESKTTALADLIAIIARAMGKPARIRELPFQPGDVNATCADISRATARIGYAPRCPVEQGIPRFVEWYLEEKARKAEGRDRRPR